MQYDKKARTTAYHVGDWVMVHFPQEESVYFASFPDRGVALIRLNIVMAPTPQSSKYTFFKMVEYKFTKHEFSIAQTSQLGSTGMEGSRLGQVGYLSGQTTSVEARKNQDYENSPSGT